MRNQIIEGDSSEVLKTFPPSSFACCVTDPPYGIGTRQPTNEEMDAYAAGVSEIDTGGDFMGKDWSLPTVNLWREVYRTMIAGGVLMAFAGSRTHDLMLLGIEAAGFSYIGMLAWVQGAGFPKSLNVSKAIDKKAGKTRKVIKPGKGFDPEKHKGGQFDSITPSTVGINTAAFNARIGEVTAPATPEAELWDGWGTALKPAWEPILVFSKGDTTFDMPSCPFLFCAKAARNEVSLRGDVPNAHPTKKPVSLMRDLVRLASDPEDLVLDPFMGSGSTAVACVDVNRAYTGIELDPVYAKSARERVLWNQDDILIAHGYRASASRLLDWDD